MQLLCLVNTFTCNMLAALNPLLANGLLKQPLHFYYLHMLRSLHNTHCASHSRPKKHVLCCCCCCRQPSLQNRCCLAITLIYILPPWCKQHLMRPGFVSSPQLASTACLLLISRTVPKAWCSCACQHSACCSVFRCKAARWPTGCHMFAPAGTSYCFLHW
jgi:hypothetical protein